MKEKNKNESKKINKKFLVIILIIVLLIIACVIYFTIFNKNNQAQDNQEVHISETLLEPIQYEDILFYDINFSNINSETEEINFQMKNLSEQATEDQWVTLLFKDELGNDIASTPLKIPALQPGETTSASVGSTADLKQAIQFNILETEAPAEVNPDDLM